MKPTAEQTLNCFDKILSELNEEKAAKPAPVNGGNGDGGRLDVPAYCAHFGIEILVTKDAPGGGTMYCLKHCVFDENHGPNESSIIQRHCCPNVNQIIAAG